MNRTNSLERHLVRTREDCRLCASRDVILAVPMAPLPVITPNMSTFDKAASSTTAPVDLFLCRSCGHVQLLTVVDPTVQYSNYLYTTSVSLGLPHHFEDLAKVVLERIRPKKNSLIVEIGSNDGTLLRFFKAAGMRVLGVDPATRIASQATEAGIETLPEFFNADLARRLRAERGAASIILANNVIANVDDLAGLAEGIRNLLASDGVFVFETQYGADVIRRKLVDTIYHEHLSYFMVKPLVRFFEGAGMELIDAEPIATKGGSLRITAQGAGGRRPVRSSRDDLVAAEEREGMYAVETYREFAAQLKGIKADLAAQIQMVKAGGRIVAGYGTSVGTLTLLHQFDLTHALDFLVDDNPFKGEFLGPDYRIPVLPPAVLYERRPAAVVLFAWRYASAIVAKHRAYLADGGKFLVPLPHLSILARESERASAT